MSCASTLERSSAMSCLNPRTLECNDGVYLGYSTIFFEPDGASSPANQIGRIESVIKRTE